MADHVVITGVPRGPGPFTTAPPRREINDLIKDQKQFSLFIQALQAMYNTSQDEGLSHFQIGGIHGMPYQQWETSGSDKSAGQWGGYCTHGTVLFPTWHRPYVATYEQVLQGHAVKIADTYTTPDKDQWQKAALNLRMPYWDWAANSIPPTQVTSDRQVSITGPDGQRVRVDNPLLAYPFNRQDPKYPKSFGAPYADWPTTLRHPVQTQSGWESNVDEMLNWLRIEARIIRTSTYNMLTRIHDWRAFSNHTPWDGASAANSLEAIHDTIHGLIGADGHMGDRAVAGFDPIFFLHHCNVDRLLALWGAMNPGVWVTNGQSLDGTWTVDENVIINGTSELTPFWNGTNSYWTSNGCREIDAPLNYTYPEFVGLAGQTPDVVKAKIGAIINRLYGSGPRTAFAFAAAGAEGATGASVAPAMEKLLAAAEHTAPAPPAAMQLFAAPAAAAAAASAATADALAPADNQLHFQVSEEGLHKYFDWTVRVHTPVFGLNGCSYSVLIFLGPVPDDPKEWRSSSSYVGAQHVFSNSKMENCDNCRRNATENLEGFVPLNEAIAAHSGLNSFESSVVEPYLKKELSWRIQKADRSGVEISEIPALQVEVIALPMHLHSGEMFPKIGTPVHHHGITEGQPGGRQPA